MLAIGGCGMMITASNVAPHSTTLRDIRQRGHRWRHCAELETLSAIPRGRARKYPIPVKYMLRRLGVLKANEHRLPLVPASPDVEKQLDEVLANVGLV